MRKRNVKNAIVKTIAFVSATAMLSTSFSTISFAQEVPEDAESVDSAYSKVVESDLTEDIALDEIEEVAAAEVEEAEATEVEAEDAETEEVDAEEAETEEVDAEEAEDMEDAEAKDVESAEADAEDAEAEDAEIETVDVEDAETDEVDAEDAEDVETEEADVEVSETEEDALDSEIDEVEAEEIDTEEEVSIANELGGVTNGWEKQSDGTYKYYENGVAVYNTVKKIGNDYFGFDYYGIMYDDAFFSIWEEDVDNWVNYCAKKGGYLYVNSWYEDEWGGLYYFGAGGRANVGNAVLTIDGVKYLFSNGGWLNTYGRTEINGVIYISDEYGKAYALKKGGWTKVGEYWYYLKADGSYEEDKVFPDGGKYYYWTYGGRVLCDDNTSSNGYAYRAKADCSLYVNEWYESEWGDKYYYGAEGKASTSPCVQTIGGKLYLFYGYGSLHTDGSATINGVTYISDENGIATKAPTNGWCQVGKEWYYIENGQVVTNQIKKIGGFYYAFDSSGRMYADVIFSMNRYDEAGNYLGNFNFYADADGHVYVNKWRLDNGNWYYYDAYGARVSGWKTISGTKYFFNPDYSGIMMRSCYVLDGNDIYRLGSDGVAKKISNPSNLFYDVYENFAVYYENGTLVKNAWRNINGKYFYFDSEGSAVRGQARKIANVYYVFNADGTMATKGWVKFGEYYTYYVKNNDGNLAIGEQQIGDKYYYFGSDGRMRRGLIKYDGKLYILNPDGSWAATAKEGWNSVQGTWYYVKNGNFVTGKELQLADGTYYFDYNGAMVKNTVYNQKYYGSDGKRVTKTGWYKVDTKWIYIQNGSMLYDGVKTINKTEYAFDYDGFMVSNSWYEGVYYNADGIAVKKSTKDGWQLYGGRYYYYKNGSLVHNTWVGDYYIGSQGYMLRNQETPDNYYVGDDGKYVKNTVINGRVIKSNGKKAKNEFVTIGSKKYYAMEDGYACTYEAYVIGKNLYQFKINYDNGYLSAAEYVKTIATNVQNNKWYQFGNQWAYVRDGQVITNGIAEIGGVNYYFYNGVMMTNCKTDTSVTGDYSYELENRRVTYFGSDGKEVKNLSGWVDGYYYGADHRTSYGWVQVNGKLYYGYSISGRSEYEVINGRIYQFDTKTGALKNEVYKYNGWLQVGSDWYYFENGTAVKGVKTIGKATYAFDYDGHMLKNSKLYTYSGIYYVNSEGIIDTTSGFRTVNGQQIYIDKDGKIATGIRVINGKTYYFEAYDYFY